MKNVYLIGFMGAGKSTIARGLSEEYGLKHMEMDEQIEKEEGMKISEIFELKGEAYFREKETKLLEYCTAFSDLVVSCGGGVPMRTENVLEMKKNGHVVWLNVSSETVYKRVKNTHHRPLLEGNMNVSYIEELLNKRRPKYEAAADVVVFADGKSIQEICREIIRKCR